MNALDDPWGDGFDDSHVYAEDLPAALVAEVDRLPEQADLWQAFNDLMEDFAPIYAAGTKLDMMYGVLGGYLALHREEEGDLDAALMAAWCA